ncbi:MAG: hypothetical protein AAF851_02775 [Myxococcota bacterium]
MKPGQYIRSAAMLIAPALVACGADQVDYVGARIELPEQREARVSVTPAVDLSGVVDDALADGLLIEQVVINLADARLLGADPSLPPGGLPLLDGPRLVYAEGDGVVGLELPFPAKFLGQEDLAVYLRTAPSDKLDGAAVKVVASLTTGGAALTGTGMIDPEGDPAYDDMIDPEGDPAHEGMIDPEGDPAREGMIDPEGDPAREGMIDPEGDPAREGMIDPEGDPAREGETRQKGQSLSSVQTTQLVLLDRIGTEIVVSFQSKSRFNVIFGIRADAWLNDMAEASRDKPAPGPDVEGRSAESARVVVIESDAAALGAEVEEQLHAVEESEESETTHGDAYYGGDDIPVEDSVIRDPFGGF